MCRASPGSSFNDVDGIHLSRFREPRLSSSLRQFQRIRNIWWKSGSLAWPNPRPPAQLAGYSAPARNIKNIIVTDLRRRHRSLSREGEAVSFEVMAQDGAVVAQKCAVATLKDDDAILLEKGYRYLLVRNESHCRPIGRRVHWRHDGRKAN